MQSPSAPNPNPLSPDSLYSLSRDYFSGFSDSRASNVQHTLKDVLMSGLAMYSLKYPSLLNFEQQSVSERSNLHHLFGVKKLCSDAQMRKILDEVASDSIREFYPQLWTQIKQAGLVKKYQYLGKYVIASLDGVSHFHSTRVHCPQCLEQHHRNGTISYSHSMLCAAMVHPNQKEVFVLGSEPILKRDGETKNDCELNAAKRMTEWLAQKYPQTPFLLVEDALYANGPHLKDIRDKGWQFIVNVKPKSHKSMFESVASRIKRGKAKKITHHEGGYKHQYLYTNNLPINGTHGDLRVNFVQYEITTPKGKTTRFSWVSSLNITKSNVTQIVKAARARWKIENETFNTLKNQGYHFEHNYGHGKKHLATNLAFLMLIAFIIDQIVQACFKLFRLIWQTLKTKAKLWETLRALFLTISFKSFQQLYRKLAHIHQVKIE